MVHKNLDEIIDSVISTITTKYPLVRKEDIKPDSLLRIMIEAIAIEISSLYGSADDIEARNRVSTATKNYLDLIGNSIGIYRKGGQDDDSYRFDIINWVRNSRTSSYSAIEKVIRDNEDIYTYAIENLANGAGTFSVHIQTKDSANTNLIAQQLYEQIKEVVAEGISFKVIVPKEVKVELELMAVGDIDTSAISSIKAAVRRYITSIKPNESLYLSAIESAAITSSSKVSAIFIVNIKINGRTMYSKEAKLLIDEQFRISDSDIVVR